MKPGEILDSAFRRQYGMAPAAPTDAAAAPPQVMPDEQQAEKLERIAATQMLTEAQSLPPIGPNDVAAFLSLLAQSQNGNRR